LNKVLKGFVEDTENPNGLYQKVKALSPVGNPIVNEDFLGGHSAGNHVTIQNLVDTTKSTDAKTCAKVRGVVMLSPVDGEDPLGFGSDFIIPKDSPLSVVVPGLIIKAEEDPLAAIGGVSCA